jgi:D-aspartate ligase
MLRTPAVVVPPDEHMGLDVARSLGRKGIPVYGVDPDPKAVGGKSRYIQLVVSPDPIADQDDFLEFIVDWASRFSERPVLFPLSDEMVHLCSLERDQLLQSFVYVMPKHEILERLQAKKGLIELADRCGVPAPATYSPEDIRDVQALSRQIRYPVVLKPIESSYWHKSEIAVTLRHSLISGREKVIPCSHEAELIRQYQRIAEIDDRVIIQEEVLGPVTNGAYITFYMNRKSEPLGIFAGRKMRVLPLGYGSSCYVRSLIDPELERDALRLLQCVGYQGLGGLEFKKDERGGPYKVIEFNTRYGMWDGLGIFCGIDNPYLAYLDALGQDPEPQSEYPEGVVWFDWQRDVRAFWMMRGRGEITLQEWLRSLQGRKMWPIYSRDDWGPGVAFTIDLMKEFSRRLWHWLVRKS